MVCPTAIGHESAPDQGLALLASGLQLSKLPDQDVNSLVDGSQVAIGSFLSDQFGPVSIEADFHVLESTLFFQHDVCSE